mgnify:CR=1 FL=1
MQYNSDELVRTAHALADAAREAVLPYFRSAGLDAENKLEAGFDPVTEADKAAERAMRAILAERRPDDAIVGEEYGASAGTTGLTWVLDPIDGTRAFLSGTPTWGVLISVADQTGPLYGIIDQPYIGERCGDHQAVWSDYYSHRMVIPADGIAVKPTLAELEIAVCQGALYGDDLIKRFISDAKGDYQCL